MIAFTTAISGQCSIDDAPQYTMYNIAIPYKWYSMLSQIMP